MPILVNNSLPSTNLHLNMVEDDKSRMLMLIDTDAVINTCNLSYHLLLMLECPEMIDELLQYDMNTEYDIMQLLAALGIDPTQQFLDYGKND